MGKFQNQKKVYELLKYYGFSDAGAFGVLGNMEAESNTEPFRLQGDFTADRSPSLSYVSKIRSGEYSRSQFMNDRLGFGLCQWTFPTWKRELYDFGLEALDSVEWQVKFLVFHLTKWDEFAGLLNTLKTSTDLSKCTSDFLTIYEKPQVKNFKTRYSLACSIQSSVLSAVSSDFPDTLSIRFPWSDTEVTYGIVK